MHACWAWVNEEWVKGWDVGTTTVYMQGHVTIFRPDEPEASDDEYRVGYYCQDWQLYYGEELPDREGEEYVPYTR